MKTAKLKIENSPKAILHIDGDSFFASCETSLNPRLKGKPVVTGRERGIASSMSKEAKALGISRGMPVFKIKELFPQVIILASDYGIYELFAQRMYAIVRRYALEVEEYSIDECFADLTGLDKTYGMSYQELVAKIKSDLQSELGMTFSLGLAPTKVLAKLASSKNKPDGLTVLTKEKVVEFLQDLDVGKVWGIGPATAQELRSKGINTAFDLMNQTEGQGRDNLNKHTFEIWQELNGIQVFPIEIVGESPKSIQATRTFTPPSSDKNFILAELSKNTESACVKMRQNKLAARKIYFFLKTQEFRYHRHELVLGSPVSTPAEIVRHIVKSLDIVWRPYTPYRATGVTLASLIPCDSVQNDLFGSHIGSERWAEVFKTVDIISRRYGSHTMTLTSSLEAFKRRGGASEKRLRIPYMGEVS